MEQFCQDKIYKIAIVGGGPSGIYCALNILSLFKKNNFTNYSLTIFDKAQILRTILPTGGGRCNITNSIYDMDDFISNYPRGDRFLRSIFSKHFNYDSIEFFNNIGIKTYIQEDGRVFPESNSSKDVKDKMLTELKKYKNVFLVNKEINSKDELIDFDRVVISSGSRHTETILKSFNQPFMPFRKALCALVVSDFIYPKGVSIQSLDGDFIFTDNGISGPLAFKISSLNVDKKFPYNISINLFDVEQLKQNIMLNPKKSIGNVVSQFIPKSLAKIVVKDFDKKSAEVSKNDMIKYSKLNLNIISTTNQGEIVNAGGVELNSITSNCKSKLVDNLWFCGEILNIDGFCGGFNLQACWSSAYCVSQDLVKTILKI